MPQLPPPKTWVLSNDVTFEDVKALAEAEAEANGWDIDVSAVDGGKAAKVMFTEPAPPEGPPLQVAEPLKPAWPPTAPQQVLFSLAASVLQACLKRSLTAAEAAEWAGQITVACNRFRIATGREVAAFLAQVGHESGDLRRMDENLVYTNPQRLRDVFPRKFVTLQPGTGQPLGCAEDYLNQPEKLGNFVYGGEGGNRPGTTDGFDFRGGGLIQLTHRSGFQDFGQAVGKLAEDAAIYARTREGAAMSAAWYFVQRGLSAPAKSGNFEQVVLLTAGKDAMTPGLSKAIDFPDRLDRYTRCKAALGIA